MSPLRRRWWSGLLAWLCASLMALAAGALWMVPVMYRGAPMPFLALPIGWLLGRAIRRWARAPGLWSSLLGGYALLLAALYLRCLVAAAMLAGSLGIDLGSALRQAGPGMLLALARMGVGPAELLLYLLAALVAAAAAWPRRP